MQDVFRKHKFWSLPQIALTLFLSFTCGRSYSQAIPAETPGTDSLSQTTEKANDSENFDKQYDAGDLFRDLLHPRAKPDSLHKESGITIVPNIASNPTIGSQIGIKAVAGRKLGTDPNTLMSIAATSASITTKGIIYFYLNHNVFTPGNKWNLQGSFVVAKLVTPDFGIGIGKPTDGNVESQVLVNADRRGFVLHSLFFNFREKVYKKIYGNFFAGAGLSFDIRRNIEYKSSTTELRPYNIYSDRYGFDRKGYSANGLFFNLQYITRDNPNRGYKGIYTDVGVRINQTWMGSSKNAAVLSTDFRKYWSLSDRNPEHVIAFWNLSAYLLGGKLPYLELPGTGREAGSRSGRGYLIGYFTGTQFFYNEGEYRFPITRNKLLSGVVFLNMQTANDIAGTRLFSRWQPGGGAGLRILFNKATRTNLCFDYAWGNYGSHGFFLGLNEAF